LRAVAQLISYEIALSLILLPLFFCAGSLNLIEIVNAQIYTSWYIIPLLPLGLMFFITILAETNRTPFDLPEAEAELVAGFNVEYSSTAFAMFFLAEYGSMFLMSTLFAIFFLGG
jgi:NADH-quinone oxidoreductase subunit H